MNTKLHAVADAKGRPIGFFMSAGQVSDYTGAAALLGSLPKAGWLLGDRGYDADWFRDALKNKGIKVCIPGRKSRKKAVKYDKRRYKRRNRIEIMFGRLKDWRRVATRYDRCPETFFSAIMLAANRSVDRSPKRSSADAGTHDPSSGVSLWLRMSEPSAVLQLFSSGSEQTTQRSTPISRP